MVGPRSGHRAQSARRRALLLDFLVARGAVPVRHRLLALAHRRPHREREELHQAPPTGALHQRQRHPPSALKSFVARQAHPVAVVPGRCRGLEDRAAVLARTAHIGPALGFPVPAQAAHPPHRAPEHLAAAGAGTPLLHLPALQSRQRPRLRRLLRIPQLHPVPVPAGVDVRDRPLPHSGLRRTLTSWVFVRRNAGARPLSYTGTPSLNATGLSWAARPGSTSSPWPADADNTSFTTYLLRPSGDQPQRNVT